MRLTVYPVILFFVCLNLALFMMNETALLGELSRPPYEEPTAIIENLFYLDLSTNTLIMAGTSLVVSIIVGFIAGNMIYGGTVAIILFALNLLFPIVRWVLFGFPIFLAQIGVPTVVITVVNVLMSVVWFWFILGIIAQRQLEK